MSSADHHTDSDELDPDEPRTPMWLPLLGGGLFLLALFLFLATRTDEEPTDETSAGAEIAAEDGAPGEEAAAPAAAPAAARAQRAPSPAAGDNAPAGGKADSRNRAPDDPHFGHDHD